MRTSRGFSTNEYYNGVAFDNLDDAQPPKQRFAPIVLRSRDQEYQQQEPRDVGRQRTSKPGRSTFFSKRCLIGLGIGLVIGIVVLAALTIPLGVIPICHTGTITSTPNWIGTYLMDDACDSSRCCCFTNQITFIQPSNNLLQISGPVIGQCGGFPPTVTLSQIIPIGFQAMLTWSGQPVRVQLGQDSAYVAFVDYTRGFCSTSGVRISYNAGSIKSMNLVLVIFILLITIGIMK